MISHEGAKRSDTYAVPLRQCVQAAEYTCATLHLQVQRREIDDTYARITAVVSDSARVVFEMNSFDRLHTHVTFTVGDEPSGNNERSVLQIKLVFDRALEAPPVKGAQS
jgi:hypothetical protein